MNRVKKSLIGLGVASTLFIGGCDSQDTLSFSVNDLDFVVDFFRPELDDHDAIKAESKRLYTSQEEAEALNLLVDKRKVDILLHDYLKLVNEHIRHLSPSGERLVMRELFEVMKFTEMYYNAKYDVYNYEIYQLVQKKKTLDILGIKELKGKQYLTDLFKESRKDHLVLIKENYVEEYGVEVDYQYVYDRYSRYMEDDYRTRLKNWLYDSQQYNVHVEF